MWSLLIFMESKVFNDVNTCPLFYPVGRHEHPAHAFPVFPVRFISIVFYLYLPRKQGYGSRSSDYATICMPMESPFDYRQSKDLALLQCVQTRPRAYTASYWMGTRALFPVVKLQNSKVDPSFA